MPGTRNSHQLASRADGFALVGNDESLFADQSTHNNTKNVDGSAKEESKEVGVVAVQKFEPKALNTPNRHDSIDVAQPLSQKTSYMLQLTCMYSAHVLSFALPFAVNFIHLIIIVHIASNTDFTTLFQFLDSAVFTFEERFNEGISGTDAKANGETAADIMKVVKEEVLLVSCPRQNITTHSISIFRSKIK